MGGIAVPDPRNKKGSPWLPFSHRCNGAPGEIRTPDRLVRSQVLYPTELRARLHCLVPHVSSATLAWLSAM
jgi:hypothetical protein